MVSLELYHKNDKENEEEQIFIDFRARNCFLGEKITITVQKLNGLNKQKAISVSNTICINA